RVPGPGGRTAVPGAEARSAVLAAEARAAVLDDELRAFAVAVSRARHRLIVTAVRDLDQLPSPLVDLVQAGPVDGADPRLTTVPAALDLRAVVAQCRSEVEADPRPDHPSAGLLARLAAQQVPGADPDEWYGAGAVSTDEPLWPADGPVTLSPSRLEAASTCALRWALETAGGTAADSGEQSLGTLVHAIAAQLPTGTVEELDALLDARWGELGAGDGWLGAVQRRKAGVMVRKLAAYLATADPAVAVEQPFSVRLGRVVLRGVVDRLERTPPDQDGRPGLRVIDLKTGGTAVTAAEGERHPQLGAYQLAAATGGFADLLPDARCDGAGLVYVGTSTKAVTQRSQRPLAEDPDPGWAHDLVEEVARTVSRSAVAATRNALCRHCPVRRSCPAQPDGRVVGQC
ncbi:MAG TPA: PD-(D/E)XK nuclease family protein, partial [Actinotalea sp.]|nr:PD-(D/E)XK nuclease family protein [Actinotalea sp.]